ncbi:MAG: TM2 domain-containing protein [Alcaligenaceae bacterium]|nr:TM2 domain-containing protein [Alcaligenaceae bacterium]
MLKQIVLIIAIFIVILLALTFGESAAREVFAWVSALSGVLIRNFGDLFSAVSIYLHAHTGKVLLALLLTIPISFWIIRSRKDSLAKPDSQRKIAIVLAVFLGWLGGHRFYLGQVGWGIVYLVIFYVFAPLAVILGLIDAIRYLFMDEETFSATLL